VAGLGRLRWRPSCRWDAGACGRCGGKIGGVRVLFSCRPLIGHYEPLVVLAGAVARAGHPVAFATGRPMARRARAAGFVAFEAGPAESLLGVVAHRMPSPEVLATDAGRGFFFAEVFAGLELEPRAADLERVVGTWRPDVVVHELAELAAPLVAAAAGLPYATSSYGPLPSRAVMRAAGAAAAAHWQRRGMPADAYAGAFRHLYLDVCPPSLQLPWVRELRAVQGLRPAAVIAADRDLRPPPWLDGLDPDRTVYVTFGTVWNRDAELFRRVLDALAQNRALGARRHGRQQAGPGRTRSPACQRPHRDVRPPGAGPAALRRGRVPRRRRDRARGAQPRSPAARAPAGRRPFR
jgi:UDP:flavonoid glycosyltransferase YjiC (YdhE family)